jgi:hypothetical protein
MKRRVYDRGENGTPRLPVRSFITVYLNIYKVNKGEKLPKGNILIRKLR